MKCAKCGKTLRENEKFCTVCGFYVGDTPDDEWDDDAVAIKKEKKTKKVKKEKNPRMEFTNNEENMSIRDSSGTKKGEFSYENEDLLEAYIGEDYRLIKKSPFNFWAFLLNWMYLLYRKLYISGIVGLIISWAAIVFFREYWLYYIGGVMIILGFAFNSYYIAVAKRRVEKIKNQAEETDKFTLATECKERGGVNVLFALIIYSVFLIIIFFSLISFNFNKHHNTKFWKENSENQATCISIIKTANTMIEEENKIGKVSEAVCRVKKGVKKEYEVYIKTEKDGKNYYSYYITENGYIKYKNNTTHLNELQVAKANRALSEEEQRLLNELKIVESNYQEVYNQSKQEDKLIETKKNTSEKINYRFDKEEIIR